MMAHLSVTALPADGASVGRYVRKAVEVLRDSNLKFTVHAMGSEIEFFRLDDLFRVVERIDGELVKMGATRVTIQLKIDDRRDKDVTAESKVRSALGETAPRQDRA